MASVAAIADTTAGANNEEQLVTMIVDRQLFGIPILQVQDIVEASKVTAVPLSPSAIGGMLNLRGRIVTVIDLRKLLGNDEEVAGDSQMGVTVEHKGDLYTLLVDSIGDVRSVRKSDFDKAPTTLEPETRRLCSGIYRLQGSLLVVLDVSRILTSEVIASTSVLTVAERKARKAAALEASKGDERGIRHLTSQLTGFGGNDATTENEDGDQSSDNIKQRKKENRSRRPIAERWREVIAERARQTGQTVYRMREPDAETLETAQEQMAAEEAAWQAKSQDGADQAASESEASFDDFGDPGMVPEAAYSDEPVPAESLQDEALSDEPVPDVPIADQAADAAEPPAPDTAERAEVEPANDPASEAVSDESADIISMDATVDRPVAAEEPAIDVADENTDEPAPDAAAGPVDDGAAADDMPAPTAGEVAESGKSGMLSGLWNKLRSTDDATADEPPAFDETPASDAAPAADDVVIPSDEPIADDTPAAGKKPKTAGKTAKSRGKAKSTTKKKKTPAKRKTTKSRKS